MSKKKPPANATPAPGSRCCAACRERFSDERVFNSHVTRHQEGRGLACLDRSGMRDAGLWLSQSGYWMLELDPPPTRSEVVQEMRRQRGLRVPDDVEPLPPYSVRPPKWEEVWRHIHAVRIWEAVALSLDIEPSRVRDRGNRHGADRFNESKVFKKRLLRASRSSHDELPRIEGSGYSEDSKVTLSQFAAWAKSIGWDIPDELAALAEDPSSADPVAARNRAIARRPRLDGLGRIIRRIVAKQPTITEKALLGELEKLIRATIDGVTIEAITDNAIEWIDNNKPARSTELSALKDRLSRAKKALQAVTNSR